LESRIIDSQNSLHSKDIEIIRNLNLDSNNQIKEIKSILNNNTNTSVVSTTLDYSRHSLNSDFLQNMVYNAAYQSITFLLQNNITFSLISHALSFGNRFTGGGLLTSPILPEESSKRLSKSVRRITQNVYSDFKDGKFPKPKL
jgi:hypothetical protein